MTTKQMTDWDDGTVGFHSYREVSAGELRDTIVVHPLRSVLPDAVRGVVVEFSTELRYSVGAVQRSESSITLDPEQAATFARAVSAPRMGGIVGQFEAEEIQAQLEAAMEDAIHDDSRGDVSLVEQFRRMAADAAKWRAIEPLINETCELLAGAAEPSATQAKANAGMCAQWDVDALANVARIREVAK